MKPRPMLIGLGSLVALLLAFATWASWPPTAFHQPPSTSTTTGPPATAGATPVTTRAADLPPTGVLPARPVATAGPTGPGAAEPAAIVVPAVERVYPRQAGDDEAEAVERAWVESWPAFKYPRIRCRELWSAAASGAPARLLHRSEMVADHVLVSVRPEASIDDLRAQIAGSDDLLLRRYLPLSRSALIAFDDGDPFAIDQVIAHLGRLAAVASVEPDYIVSVATEPDDPRFDECYGLHNTGQTGGTADQDIDAPEAWDLATGSRDVVVAVIDTGIDYSHEDLAANIWTNPGEIPDNGIDDDGNGFIDDVHGWDFVNDDGDPLDDNSHGSHCAGIIGAVGDNGVGIAGVNWQVSLMALKFLGATNRGAVSDATEALAYSTMMGVDVTSHSWNTGVFLQSLKDELDAAEAAGIACVAAAGNRSELVAPGDTFPATFDNDNVIAVMSLDHDGNKADNSNWGATAIDIAATGVDILSCVPNNGYQTKSGTSMATPQVAGAVALLRSVVGPDMPLATIKEALLASVDRGTDAEGRCGSNGRLNLYAALQYVGIGLGELVIDDDNEGASAGNGDGLINPGETIELTVAIRNHGGALTDLVGTLSSSNSGVSIPADEVDYGDLATAATATGRPFVCTIAADAATPELVSLTLDLRAAGGEQWQRAVQLELVTSTPITGAVHLDGAPVAGVEIFYAGDQGGSIVSAADGSYRLALPAGDYALRAQGPGWVPTATIQVTTPTADPIDFAFTTAIVEGRIADEQTEAPLPEAQVAFAGGGINGVVTSDAAGDYQIPVVLGRSAAMTIIASHPGYFPSDPVVLELPPGRSHDFALGRPIIRIEPTALSITAAPEERVDRPVAIHNDGSHDLEVFCKNEAAGDRIVDEAVAGATITEVGFIPPATEAQARTLMGVAYDGLHLYLSLWDVNKPWHAHVYQVDRASGATVAVHDYGRYTDKLQGIESLTWGEDLLWIHPYSPGTEIWKCDPATDERLLTITIPEAEDPYSPYTPFAIAWGDGSLWALDSGISRYDGETGDHLESLDLPEELPHPESLTWLDGALYVLGYTRGQYPDEWYEIWRIDPETGDGSKLFTFKDRDGSDHFEDLASDGDSKLFVTDRIRDVVVTFDCGLRGWLASTPGQATIAPGQVLDLNVTADAGLAGVGSHQGRVVVTSNDPATPHGELPVSLLVSDRVRRISMDDLPTFIWDCRPAGVVRQEGDRSVFDQLQAAEDHELTAAPSGEL